MNASTKKWLALASLAGVVATWLPQVMGDDHARREGHVELGADGAPIGGEHAEPGLSTAAQEPEEESGLDAADAGQRASEPRPHNDLGSELDRQAIAARSVVDSSLVRDLDALAVAWSESTQERALPMKSTEDAEDDPSSTRTPGARGTSAASAAVGDLHVVATQDAASIEPVVAPQTPAQILEQFIAARPLDLIVHGEERRCASLGDDLVREGDVLDGGIVVETIGVRTVLLRLGSERRRAKLAPFVARASSVEVATAQPSAQPGAGAQTAPSAAPVIDAQALVRAAAQIGKELHGSEKPSDDPKAKEPKR